MIRRSSTSRPNWILLGDATTASMTLMSALLDASGAPQRKSRDGSGRWVHRRELRRAAQLRMCVERAVAAGTPIEEVLRQLGLTSEVAAELVDDDQPIE